MRRWVRALPSSSAEYRTPAQAVRPRQHSDPKTRPEPQKKGGQNRRMPVASESPNRWSNFAHSRKVPWELGVMKPGTRTWTLQRIDVEFDDSKPRPRKTGWLRGMAGTGCM